MRLDNTAWRHKRKCFVYQRSTKLPVHQHCGEQLKAQQPQKHAPRRKELWQGARLPEFMR